MIGSGSVILDILTIMSIIYVLSIFHPVRMMKRSSLLASLALCGSFLLPVVAVQAQVPAEELVISIDGHAAEYLPGQANAVLANVVLKSKGPQMIIKKLFIAIEGKVLPDGRSGPNNPIKGIITAIQLRNKVTGQVINAQEFNDIPQIYWFQIYRFENIPATGNDTWELRVTFKDNGLSKSPKAGEGYRAHICGEPVMQGGQKNNKGCTFGGLLPSPNTQVQLSVTAPQGRPIFTVRPGGNIAGNIQKILGPATLNITQKSTGSADTAVKNQANVNLLRFEARGQNRDILLTQAVFEAAQGSTLNAQNYSLWVDTDKNGSVDTIAQKGVSSQGGKVAFNAITGGGYVIPKDATVILEVHADIAASLSSNVLQLRFAKAQANYIGAETLNGGTVLVGIKTDGVCQTTCQINVTTTSSIVYKLVSQGDLYVTLDTTPQRSRQLLGGTLGDGILGLQFRAEHEDVDVTDLQLTAIGQTSGGPQDILRSVDRFELYKVGETTPFALATIGGCATDTVPANTMCANMENGQLVAKRGQNLKVIVRPRIKSDQDGGERNDFFTLTIAKKAISDNATGEGAVRARGWTSSNNLMANDEDNVAEGEIFIGTSSPSANQDIAGKKNQTVLSKIVSITNANPDANNTAIPTGISPVGQFKFTAATNTNSRNGLNKAVLSDIIFTVNATNVRLQVEDFRFYNKGDASVQSHCVILNADGMTQTTGTVEDGVFAVKCSDFDLSGVDTEIGSGNSATVVLQAGIANSKIDPAKASALQVSFGNFSSIDLHETFGYSESHVQWLDMDTDGSAYQWIEYPETIVNSPHYKN
jgi:hypothetical protein